LSTLSNSFVDNLGECTEMRMNRITSIVVAFLIVATLSALGVASGQENGTIPPSQNGTIPPDSVNVLGAPSDLLPTGEPATPTAVVTPPTKTPVPATATPPAPPVSQPDCGSNGDGDGDGLTGTQEDNYKTNPCDPDTDRDGVKDGKEISCGSDPRISNKPQMIGLDGCFDGNTDLPVPGMCAPVALPNCGCFGAWWDKLSQNQRDAILLILD
jgi:hypothetical protein